jgi:hypothetical protein
MPDLREELSERVAYNIPDGSTIQRMTAAWGRAPVEPYMSPTWMTSHHIRRPDLMPNAYWPNIYGREDALVSLHGYLGSPMEFRRILDSQDFETSSELPRTTVATDHCHRMPNGTESLNPPNFQNNRHPSEFLPLSESFPSSPGVLQPWTSNGDQGQQVLWISEEWPALSNYQPNDESTTNPSISEDQGKHLCRHPEESLSPQPSTSELHSGSWSPATGPGPQHGKSAFTLAEEVCGLDLESASRCQETAPHDTYFEETSRLSPRLVKYSISPSVNHRIMATYPSRSCAEADLRTERMEIAPISIDADQRDNWIGDCLIEYPRDSATYDDDPNVAVRESGLPILPRHTEKSPSSHEDYRSSRSPLPSTLYVSQIIPLSQPPSSADASATILWSQEDTVLDSESDCISNHSSSADEETQTPNAPSGRSEKEQGTRQRAGEKAPKGPSHRSDARDAFLIECKRRGMSYKEIKKIGRFEEAESTLRGRFRTLTKRKDQRVRKPKWQPRDVSASRVPPDLDQK